MSFKDKYRDFSELVRELHLLRDHNKTFKNGDKQDNLLLFAEGALVILALERFLRILPSVEAKQKDTLPNLEWKKTGNFPPVEKVS